jgi:hypothetical protein
MGKILLGDLESATKVWFSLKKCGEQNFFIRILIKARFVGLNKLQNIKVGAPQKRLIIDRKSQISLRPSLIDLPMGFLLRFKGKIGYSELDVIVIFVSILTLFAEHLLLFFFIIVVLSLVHPWNVDLTFRGKYLLVYLETKGLLAWSPSRMSFRPLLKVPNRVLGLRKGVGGLPHLSSRMDLSKLGFWGLGEGPWSRLGK